VGPPEPDRLRRCLNALHAGRGPRSAPRSAGFAPEDLKIGERWQERIEDSIRIYDKVMIVLSDASDARIAPSSSRSALTTP
jgi:hypothetical protein